MNNTNTSNALDALMSDNIKLKFKAMLREFDSLQPDGDTPTSGYLSLNARQALITKHLGPFGFLPNTKVINYPTGAVVETTMLIRLNGIMTPWFRRYGSAENALRADGDLAQAGISAWRKVFVAMGLANMVELEGGSRAEARADLILFISRTMTEMNFNSLTMLIGSLRANISSLDVTPQEVQNLQVASLSDDLLRKISDAISELNKKRRKENAAISSEKDGF